MDKVSRSKVVRSVLSWRNVQQDTVRIARTVRKVSISGHSVRAVLSRLIDRKRTVTDRRHRLRPHNDRMEIGSLAGLSPRNGWCGRYSGQLY
jgi:hypothetical protein